MVEKYKKGKRTYTHWDNKSTQVNVETKQRKEGVPPAQKTGIDLPGSLENGAPANLFALHHTKDEFVLDCAQSTGQRARIRGRIIMSPQTAKRLMGAIKNTVS